jgi:hypothetical protein
VNGRAIDVDVARFTGSRDSFGKPGRCHEFDNGDDSLILRSP